MEQKEKGIPKDPQMEKSSEKDNDGDTEKQEALDEGVKQSVKDKKEGAVDCQDAGSDDERMGKSTTMPACPGMGHVSTYDTNITSSTPGAFAIEGYASRERNESNNNHDQASQSDIESPVLEAEVSIHPNGSSTTPSTTNPSRATMSTSEVDISHAYLVEENEVHGEAIIVKTWCGIDQKCVVIIVLVAIGLMVAIVLGVNPNRGDEGGEIPSCGPLCGADTDVPTPEQIVLGLSCEDWNLASLVPNEDGICDSRYGAASYACECPNVEIPRNACGGLCRSGDALLDPDKIVSDVHGRSMTCCEWELLSKFDVTSNDSCSNYNAIGVLCGCQDNVPPPEACGSLCADNLLPRPDIVVLGQSCEEWNTLSSFLPVWQDSDETCSQMFQDVAYRCECPELVKPPPDECNALCKERSFCGASMCQDDSPIPEPDKVVRGMACKDWSLFSRLADHVEMCFFYEMIGAECGCGNTPPSNACGPLCRSEEALAYPSREVRGQRCDEWNSMSTFLFAGYGEAIPGTTSMVSSTCDNFFSPIAFGCGCPAAELPENGCGYLCQNGLPVPEPYRIVGDQTCGDLELKSLYETDHNTCYRYRTTVASQCGCVDNEASDTEYWSQLQCFSTKNLDDRTFFFFSGMSQYSVSFGETGQFVQIQNQNSKNIIGRFSGFESLDSMPANANNMTSFDDEEAPRLQVTYGGGYRCGQYGPRRGTVVLVEDDSIVVPYIASVIEPSICVYRAILHVPSFC